MPKPLSLIRFLAFAGALLVSLAAARADTRLLRFPDIHDDRVAFTYGGNIWTAPAGGGTAIHITTHPGLELFPKFSPDGKWIAFTGQYDGDEQVYVIPSGGGVPRQLTFYPACGPAEPLGRIRQPGAGLDTRRQVGAVPLHARRRRGAQRGRDLHRRHGRRGGAPPARARRGLRGHLAGRQEPGLRPGDRATSAAGNATRAGAPRDSSSWTWPPAG